MGANSQGSGYHHNLSEPEVWEVFDNLPEDLRIFIDYAPYQVSPVALRDMLKQSNSEHAVLRHCERRMAELVPARCFKAYGREHPQSEGYLGI